MDVLDWVGNERIAISGVPTAAAVTRLAEQGVTHIVNCRPRFDVWWAGDLAAERAVFGPAQVAHAPMQDHGLRQRPAAWAPAARFAAQVLDDQPQAGVLIHCTMGMHRSAMVAYAVLRLRGHDRTKAADLVLRYRRQAELFPAYVRSVERWLATAAGQDEAGAVLSEPDGLRDSARRCLASRWSRRLFRVFRLRRGGMAM